MRSAAHPTLGRGYLECAYAPMVELLGYLDANGFSNYIVSGGGRDFMRPISQDMYGIPRERVIGSSSTFVYTSNDHGGTITHKPEADYLDDGPEKPCGSGTAPAGAPCSRPETPTATSRCSSSPTTPTSPHYGSSSFTTTPSASSTTPPAPSRHSAGQGDRWTVVSIKNDWTTVF